jgi:hypothetical protein
MMYTLVGLGPYVVVAFLKCGNHAQARARRRKPRILACWVSGVHVKLATVVALQFALLLPVLWLRFVVTVC